MEREIRRERIKTHVSMRDGCFKSCQKVVVQILFLQNTFFSFQNHVTSCFIFVLVGACGLTKFKPKNIELNIPIAAQN